MHASAPRLLVPLLLALTLALPAALAGRASVTMQVAASLGQGKQEKLLVIMRR